MTGEEYLREEDYFEGGEEDLPLKEGVVGSKIVAHFEKLGLVAVAAESLGAQGADQWDYKVTFDNGLVQAYRVTFADRFEIVDATPLN